MSLFRLGGARTMVCAAAVVSGVAMVTAAMALTLADPPAEFGTVPTFAGADGSAVPRPSFGGTEDGRAPSSPLAAALVQRVPDRLVLPSLGIAAAVVPVPVRGDGSLVVPPDPRQVGWWVGGAYPGATTGTVLVAGHVDDVRIGLGALFHVASLRQGDLVALDTPVGRYTYRVMARREYPKQRLPPDLFGQRGQARLVLVTCGGSFDPDRGYADNVVIYTEPAAS
ncbi:class F sortase [Gandjariella thermophila]|uniref:Class F sortase n=1 Tax=Gandjariella thermophila TaxID=1931992 RepID=A0A4D4J544_9PSEU|nr:class F sortase [Gandjariella thermophila]GDY31795.1 class F sortase [Gandjariella thermophila]